MKGVLRWITSLDQEEEEPKPKRVPMERVEEFVRYFPIGTRLRYTPEFQVSTKIESIILGYRINGIMVFEAHSVRFSASQGQLALHLRTERGVESFTDVDEFCFILPHQFRSEVDFGSTFGEGDASREKKVNDFRRGASIRLMNKGLDGKVPSIETLAIQTVGITQGIYSNIRVVLLAPDPDSFQLMDQRIFTRIYTQIPATVAVDVNGPRYKCTLIDFSERFIRLNMDESQQFCQSLREGSKLFVVIEGEPGSGPILLGGQVYRKRQFNCVLALTHVLKEKRLQRIDPIDELELKTRLLHHPRTTEKKSET